MGRFPDEKHFASWLGLCPRTDRSNKTEKRRTPRKGKNRVAQALRMAAQAVGRTQTALGQFYRRIKSRIGGRGAITATAHKLSRLVYRMLKFGTEYVARSLAEYEAQVREKLERSLRRKAQALGYELVAKRLRPCRREGARAEARRPIASPAGPDRAEPPRARGRGRPHDAGNRVYIASIIADRRSEEFTGRRRLIHRS